MNTRKVANYDEAKQKGDYFIQQDAEVGWRLFIVCPNCGRLEGANGAGGWTLPVHDPLTLKGSIKNVRDGCHYSIANGEVQFHEDNKPPNQ